MTAQITPKASTLQGNTAAPKDFLDIGQSVLKTEAAALEQLAQTLDESFTQAVDWLSGIRGHVIVTGIGKSGHIAGKIAATLASTGTPAFFVHPSEAAHGDLGMITRNDVIIALSESGNSDELAGIIHYSRRRFIPLIAITREKDSQLGRAADLILAIPSAPSACPLRLAPTTSTTMMLALGDALAVALLEKRDFSAEDFREFHPGGSLGRKLQMVTDIMHSGDAMPLVLPHQPMTDVVVEMTAKRFGCTGVLSEDGNLIGIITDGDLRRNIKADLQSLTASDVMTKQPKTIGEQNLAAKALATMNEYAITTLFVVNEQQSPVGILHIHDCLKIGES